MPLPSDLTTLANVKQWLKITTTDDDGVLGRMISQTSRTIFDYLQRGVPTISRSYTDVQDGRDQSHLFMSAFPVTGVQQVVVDSRIIDPAPFVPGSALPQLPGWRLDPWDGNPPGGQQAVELCGYRFTRGALNCSVTYTAGYLISGEANAVATGAATVIAPLGPWSADGGVAYADGTAFVNVASSPAVGEYVSAGAGVYNFNAGDDGQAIAISYSFVPGTLEDAAISLVAERFRRRDRIGERSRSIAAQTTASYDLKDIPDYIELSLRQYKRILPIG